MSFYWLALGTVANVYRLLWGVRRRGHEHLPMSGGVILAANHRAYLDPPAVAIGAIPRDLTFLAKQDLFRFAPFGRLISALGAFPVDRSHGDVAAIRRALHLLKTGHALLLFPEGGRNRDGSKQAKGGVALLARLSGAPVVPVHIDGTERARLRHPITVTFGEPEPYDGGSSSEAMAEWSSALMEKITRLGHRTPER